MRFQKYKISKRYEIPKRHEIPKRLHVFTVMKFHAISKKISKLSMSKEDFNRNSCGIEIMNEILSDTPSEIL